MNEQLITQKTDDKLRVDTLHVKIDQGSEGCLLPVAIVIAALLLASELARISEALIALGGP